MTPPTVDNYSPGHNVYEQNPVPSTLDNQSQDLQQNGIAPIPTPLPQQIATTCVTPCPQQGPPVDMTNIVDSIDVQMQPTMLDQMNNFRRSGM